jgi:CRP-like cAMP-binding protein
MLVNFTADIEFFKKLKEENSSEAHVKCCQFMHYERIGPEALVIDYREIGDMFYIILQGSVRVFVPSSSQEGNFEDIGVLCKGKSFGELALTKEIPRAARIISVEDTQFATLNKRDCKAILGKLSEQALNSRVAYLQGLPVFSSWTKQALFKLSYFFREIKLTWKQVVFRQGDQANEVYFIKEGEFQLSTSLKQAKAKDSKFLMGRSHSVIINALVALLGNGELLGDDDATLNCPRTTTCVCHSSTRVLFAISKQNFTQRVNRRELPAYLKARNETKTLTRSARIETFLSLVTKGHLMTKEPPFSLTSLSMPLRKCSSQQSTGSLEFKERPLSPLC